MVIRIADNILSPLGESTAQNYEAVKEGRTQLRRYEQYEGIPEPFTASMFTASQWQQLAVEGMTRFESLAFRSAQKAIRDAAIDVTAPNVLFILSTTKGNIEQLSQNTSSIHQSLSTLATALGIQTEPIGVCNACISGVSAIILAMRLLESRVYDYAVVTGADILTPFVISGFQSLKALSADACRPFDIERLGLNLGEAAATIVLQRCEAADADSHAWQFAAGAVRNDGFHISSPSKNGEGLRLALEAAGAPSVSEQMAFINAHGTATMFNDQMESVAIERAGLTALPVNAIKGYFGHTLGAAGIMETILSMAAVDDHTVLGTKGYTERGVSGKILLSAENSQTNRPGFIKTISGFGGCNAALVATHLSPSPSPSHVTSLSPLTSHNVKITPTSATVDGQPLACEGEGMALLTDLYKRYIGDYPKFYKMDALSRLGFVASELLLQAEADRRGLPRTDRAIVLFNRSSSIQADLSYLASIQDPENYFPSPSAFVYTLPNIVTGEIAIRNGYQGETSFYILPERDDELMNRMIRASFMDEATGSMIGGWIDCEDGQQFMADLCIIERSK